MYIVWNIINLVFDLLFLHNSIYILNVKNQIIQNIILLKLLYYMQVINENSMNKIENSNKENIRKVGII